ncbi:rRNA accumulation- protein [Dimargaris cristalligena]|uniref:Pre-rRNA-processing protein TSR2-domain-containing protein n=1 Tax=Dimargaris cristalligena TaxID=215637 RepID=A0A4Q0A2H2_9FUNG|nr:rRNA accumulation- protein [Dimargaris cristalligena]RKP39370.1 Pre-rRNA-processing protein TSR2-domain-containing protein [Dimargaris cristalligena]|eukprot:RKP39370.1 Pre-rRNA-processing protein TSR2-domain-containing protein [Dimargaris cristalligena]
MAQHPNRVAFNDGMTILLTSWPVLKSAVDEDWGGPESSAKRDWLIDTLVTYIGDRGNKTEPEDIEDVMLQILEDEFGVTIGDESVYALAKFIIRMYKECIAGNHTMVQNLKAEAEKKRDALPLLTAQPGPEDDASGSDSETESGSEDDDSEMDDSDEDSEEDSDDDQDEMKIE